MTTSFPLYIIPPYSLAYIAIWRWRWTMLTLTSSAFGSMMCPLSILRNIQTSYIPSIC